MACCPLMLTATKKKNVLDRSKITWCKLDTTKETKSKKKITRQALGWGPPATKSRSASPALALAHAHSFPTGRDRSKQLMQRGQQRHTVRETTVQEKLAGVRHKEYVKDESRRGICSVLLGLNTSSLFYRRQDAAFTPFTGILFNSESLPHAGYNRCSSSPPVVPLEHAKSINDASRVSCRETEGGSLGLMVRITSPGSYRLSMPCLCFALGLARGAWLLTMSYAFSDSLK